VGDAARVERRARRAGARRGITGSAASAAPAPSGATAHTVTAAEGADFDSGSIAPGDTFTFTPTTAGTVSYVCTFHPGMRGTIDVS
jgi:hypothetical protein